MNQSHTRVYFLKPTAVDTIYWSANVGHPCKECSQGSTIRPCIGIILPHLFRLVK